jgi:hypothetical protein
MRSKQRGAPEASLRMTDKEGRASSMPRKRGDRVGLLHAFERDDGNLAGGFLLILVELRHHLGLRGE